jgi:trigger factor
LLKEEITLKIETQFLEDHQAKLIVEVEADQLEEMKHRAANKLSRRVKIPGFRPGKAPYPVILRTVGDATIVEEALELLVEDIYPKAIKEANIEPYGPGKLEKVASMEPVTLEFLIPLDAKVTLGDYHAMRKPYEPKPATDQDVDDAIKELQERQALIEPVERAAQAGDVVTVKLSGERKDDAENKILLSERSVPVIIRTGDKDEWLFTGFSKNFIGLSAGAEGTIEHVFPADSEHEDLQGVPAEFHYLVENVKSRTLPEVDDEFAKSLGDFETVEALRQNVRTALETQSKSTYNDTYDADIINQTIESSQFLYPPQMLENEVDLALKDLENRLSQQGLDMDIYLKSQNKELDALKEELKPVAEKRLKRSLVLFELGQTEDIQIKQEELETEAVNTLSYLQKSLPEREARRLSNRNVRDNVLNNVMVDLMTRKTVERLRDIFSGKLENVEAAKPEAAPETPDVAPETVEQQLPEETVPQDSSSSES